MQFKPYDPTQLFRLICRTGVGFDGDKNKMPSKNGGHFNVVNRIGLFSNRLREELSVLYKLKLLIFKYICKKHIIIAFSLFYTPLRPTAHINPAGAYG